MVIDWKDYVLQTNTSLFHLPSIVKLKPWQLPLLYRIVPKLRVLQLTAFTGNQPPYSWTSRRNGGVNITYTVSKNIYK
jgi:hypothetical protein